MIRAFIFLLLLGFLNAIHAQPCGPIPRIIDKQFALNDGRLVHCALGYAGPDITPESESPSKLWFNYILFDSNGTITTDTVIRLPWEGVYYDRVDCKAYYGGGSRYTYSPSLRMKCGFYEAFVKEDQLMINFDLHDDPRSTYFIEISTDGIATSERIDIWNSGYRPYDEFSKFSYVRELINERYPNYQSRSQMNYVINDDSSKIEINGGGTILTNYITKCVQGCDAVYRFQFEVTQMDGQIIKHQTHPLISTTDDLVFLTVVNKTRSSCPGYGWDDYPITYCFEKKTGKLKWSTANMTRFADVNPYR